jgi:WD40 repeat protein
MPTLRPCPDRRDLEQFLLGHGDAASATELEEHLSTCPACATAAGQVSAEDALVSSVKKAADTHATPEPESVESLASAFKLVGRTLAPSGQTVSWSGAVAAAAAPADLPPDARIGGYEVRGVLGAGGMGVVYLGFDPLLRREVAVKVVKRKWRDAPAALEKFLTEARAVAAVEHDNIVAVHAVVMHDDLPCLVMPMLKGAPLTDRLGARASRPLPVADVTSLAADVLNGLAAAHAVGLIHRDIKPGNLWVEPAAGFGRVKILDFGLAVPAETDGVGMGGTPGFMPPEQVHGGAVDARADLFALGCVLYRAATGRFAFDGTSPTDCLVKTITRDPSPVRELNPAVPASLAAFIMRLLSKSPDGRPASAEAALAELMAVRVEADARRNRVTRRRWLVGVAAATAIGGFGVWLFSPGKPKDPPAVEVKVVADADVTQLVLSRDGQEQVVDVTKAGKLSLPPGEYTVRLPEALPHRTLEPASFVVLPDTPTSLTVSLSGLVAESSAHAGPVMGVAATKGEKAGSVVLSASTDRTLNAWGIGGSDVQHVAKLTSPAKAFAATPDGALLLTAGGNKQPPPELGVQRWDGRTLEPVGRPLDGHTRLVTVLAVSADGSRAVSASAGEVFLRTFAEQRRDELVLDGDAAVTAAALDATGKFALTGDAAGSLTLWDCASTKVLQKKASKRVAAVRAVAFTPTGFVSAGDDGLARVWTLPTFESRELGAKDKGQVVLCVAVSADGKRLACGGADGGVVVWSLADGRTVAAFSGHKGAVNAVAFTPDARNVISGGDDRTVRVWRLPLP